MFPSDWTEDHGDRLFRNGRVPEVSSPHPGVVLGLLMLCLIPRFWAGTIHDTLCPDAVSYLKWAEMLEAGERVEAFKYTGVNIYHPLLLGLKSLPGDWLAAAKWWSVAMATLAILPVYGWIRRQFNETLAILGCGFYALHPAMIHDSPLVIRDPTFWFLFALGLYVAWRAVSETRLRWFAAFAVVFGLMIHLRSEGWLLALVLPIWGAFRLRHAAGKRIQIVTAVAVAVAVGPITGLLIQHVMLTQPVDQVVGELRHAGRIGALAKVSGIGAYAAIAEGTLRILVRYGKAFGYCPLVLASIGLAHWRLRLFGPSKGPLLMLCVLSFGAIWASFCLTEMDRRYVFPSLIASLPTIAVGLPLAATWCSAIANRVRNLHRSGFSFYLLCLMALSYGILLVTIVISPRPLLRDQAEIGRWIRTQVGPNRVVSVNIAESRLVGYYADCQIVGKPLRPDSHQSQPPWLTESTRLPSVILVWLEDRHPTGRDAYERGIRSAKEFGYREIPVDELPSNCSRILVLVHNDAE